jgi:undecaprenyl-diphosphatase
VTGNSISTSPPNISDHSTSTRWNYRRAAILWLAGVFAFGLIAVFAHFYDRFPGDEWITDVFQDVDVPVLGGYLTFVNFLGDTWVHVVLVAGFVVLFGLLQAGESALLVLYTVVPSLLNGAIKDWVERPRPSEDFVAVSESASGFSFPSGHTVSTAALFLVLFFVVPAVVRHKILRWTLQMGCLLMVLSTGPARVYVGVHWTSDVLAGYALVVLMVVPLLLVFTPRRNS